MEEENKLPTENQETMSEEQVQKEEQAPAETPETKEKKKGGFRAWWHSHKPTKRRIIQLYAALLTNANIKGFASGRIYQGAAKYACVPGLNCYSCPGAVGACPLGSLQNAFAQSPTRMPFYVIGIILLFGLLLARTICGFLCPFGLLQDLTYKIKTPKLKKSKVTRVLSYLKYVLLAVFVISLPLIFGQAQVAVPAFCKYICPAGTLGGAVALLANPANADIFSMLHGLFTWKFCLMVGIVLASVFVYRCFCRFLCPLGALYGFFNKIALIGIKLDKNKCTDCGLCVAHCKMDIKKVGDHECINCGECIDVCPARAITWKGKRPVLHANAVEPLPLPETEERPLGELLHGGTLSVSQTPLREETAIGGEALSAPLPEETGVKAAKKRRGRGFWLEVAAWIAATAVLVGALVYFNACDTQTEIAAPPKDFYFSVSSKSDSAGQFSFTVRKEGGDEPQSAAVKGGNGSEADPYVVDDIAGKYTVNLHTEGGKTQPIYFVFTLKEAAEYTVSGASDDLALNVYFLDAYGNRREKFSLGEETSFSLDCIRGVGESCPDFTLPQYLKGGDFTLSEHKGKIVIINFWATWCGPCVTELPGFERIREEFADKVEVVAVHSSHITDNVLDFLETKTDAYDGSRTWKDWDLTFVQDSGTHPKSDVYDMLGGKDSYPMTVIVDGDGVIVFQREGSMDYERLRSQIELMLS